MRIGSQARRVDALAGLLGAVGAVAGVAEARQDEGAARRGRRRSRRVQIGTSGWMPRSRSMPSGAPSRHDQPDVLGAALLQPVDGGDRRSWRSRAPATITITSRSARSVGALKKYSTATKVSGSR